MLEPGTTLGPYRIESLLGSGGMGDVYLATDTRLNRRIAIKTLLEKWSGESDWKYRFKQEAQTVAALSHPNICTLHDVGHDAGVDFIVMEYLEGQTLAERLHDGALPVDEAIRYGIEIADALHRTHRKGVIHSDLKPANVMLTRSGVKLLDFGLARLRELSATVDESSSPTRQISRVIAGTPQYMSPEQIEDKGADARSDVFAFGAVMYEMLTGQKAFTGTSTASVFAAVLRESVPALPVEQRALPRSLDHLVRSCLQKDPEQRWQDAGDLVHQLKYIRDEASASAPVAVGRRPRWALGLLGLLAASAALLLVGGERWWRAIPPLPGVRFSIAEPPGVTLGDNPRMAVSPDGQRIAFAAGPPGGKTQLWVRRLAAPEATPLAGTDNAVLPFWSPDSRSLAFLADGKMRRIDADGGPVQTLCDAPLLDGGGSWNDDGVILFSGRDPEGPIMRVAASGGPAAPVTTLGPEETSHRWPRFLPDGRHFLYLATSRQGQRGTLFVGSLDGRPAKRLFDTPFMADFAAGFLIFKRDLALVAQPFDLATHALTGEAIPIADWVSSVASSRRVGFSASAAYLAYSADLRPTSRLAWFDRNGKVTGELSAPRDLTHIRLAPDGRQVATDSASDVWFLDVARGVQLRITLDASTDNNPAWYGDGSHVVFASDRGNGTFKLYRKSASGLGDDELLLEDRVNLIPADVSPDNRFLLFQKSTSTANTDLFALPLSGGAPVAVQATPFDEIQGRFSPDGKWIAFVTNESGQNQVNIRSFPSNQRKVQVSVDGGVQPVWRTDGQELYFVGKGGTLMASRVSLDPLDVQLPSPLFALAVAPEVTQPLPIRMSNYAASGDGTRFLAILHDAKRQDPITVLQNWVALIGQPR